MSRRLALFLFAALLLAPFASAGTCPDCSSYAVVLRPGIEADAVMPVLSVIAGAELRQESSRIVVSMTSARARLLASDGRVASVERVALRAETNTVEPWSSGVSYTYDGAGNITTIGTNSYIYDTAGRLISGTAGGASNQQQFGYDAFGNRKSATRTGGACKGGFDCESSPNVDSSTNRLKRSTTDPAAPDITYDQAGNLTMLDVSHTYTFDALGAMTKQVDGAATREYIYTADDERIGVYNGSWDWTVRDLGGRVLREYTSTGASGTSNWKWRRDHVYRGSQLLATVNQKYDASDNAVTGTITYHLHLDHLGTPRLITDGAGLLLAEHAYYPFGPELSTSLTESPRDPKQYTGHERDDIADIHGLDYMHARYYGAAVGRFLSVDPVLYSVAVATPQSWNRYSYAWNNPINSNDPDGRCSFTLTDGSSYSDDNDICAEVTAHWSAADLRQRGEDAVAGERADFLAEVSDQARTLSYLRPGDFFNGRATLHGAEAFVDGVVPDIPFCDAAICHDISDPFAANGYYDVNEMGMRSAQVIGATTRDVEMAILSAGATMETRAGADGGNWVTQNAFRWGKGSWKGSGGPQWHFHVGPGKAMLHHLPYQFNTWRYHSIAILKALMR